ncbi:hypothetical protein ES288_A09G194900v1 [Gossypium darwinii]|uniref:Uncharacterized protein n=1 Tax=Gossypium darwinii TaxID=34276 RepID=A0A5D2FEU6_GOSDA|nr:hypothetical protein ES288_A09G194900v1 [Gossypium darwinii]
MAQQAEIVCRFATFLLVRSPRFHSSCHSCMQHAEKPFFDLTNCWGTGC